jgi:hypothetical protein
MKEKDFKNFLWLGFILTETLDTLDDIDGSEDYKRRLKQTAKAFRKETNTVLESKGFGAYYANGGAEATDVMNKTMTTLKEEFFNIIETADA